MRSAVKISILLLFLPLFSLAQNPSKWSLASDAKGKSLKAGDVFKANLKAEIEPLMTEKRETDAKLTQLLTERDAIQLKVEAMLDAMTIIDPEVADAVGR